MDCSAETLQHIYDATHQKQWQQPSVGAWPYAGGSELDVEQHLHSLVSDLERSALISVEADFNSFGCGYASFVEMFCFPKDGSSRKHSGFGEETLGLSVYVSRLVPVAAYGAANAPCSRRLFGASKL